MSSGGDLSRGGGVAVRRLSAARLLWTRVVALLVFTVSPVLPARWAGRRWVGLCVVGGVGIFFLAVVTGLVLSVTFPQTGLPEDFIPFVWLIVIYWVGLFALRISTLYRPVSFLSLPGLRPVLSVIEQTLVFLLFGIILINEFCSVLLGGGLSIWISHMGGLTVFFSLYLQFTGLGTSIWAVAYMLFFICPMLLQVCLIFLRLPLQAEAIFFVLMSLILTLLITLLTAGVPSLTISGVVLQVESHIKGSSN